MPSEWQILGLGAFVGLTIFLGLPFGLRGGGSTRIRAFLSALAAGILLFLFFDVLSNAHGLVVAEIPAQGGSNGTLAVAYLALLLIGWVVGFLSLAAFEVVYARRFVQPTLRAGSSGSAAHGSIDPMVISTMIAVGIGLHNFSEGLAIGAAYAGGAIAAGAGLVIGFAAHNCTEGFGILGPGLMAGRNFSARRLLALGAVGGGPTFIGTLVGSVLYSAGLSVLFFGLAAGAIIYVVLQMVRPLMVPATRSTVWFGVVVGMSLGFVTDLVVSFGGG